MKENKISDEMLARYIAGRASAEEQAEIEVCIAEDQEFADEVLNETLSVLIQQRGEQATLNQQSQSHRQKKDQQKRGVVMRRVAAVAVVAVVGLVLWRIVGNGGSEFNLSDGPAITTAGMGNTDGDESVPCVGEFDYAFPTYEAPKEWMWTADDTLTITWHSNAPLQRFDYRFGYSDSWHKKDAKGSYSFPARALRNVNAIEWRIVVGCNKDNYDALYDTVMIIHD